MRFNSLRLVTTAIVSSRFGTQRYPFTSAFALPPTARNPTTLFLLSCVHSSAVVRGDNKVVGAGTGSAHAASSARSDGSSSGPIQGECNATDEAKLTSPPLSEMHDKEYPGTAVLRLKAVHERVKQLASDGTLNQRWEDVRRRLLWAGGLRDLPNAAPGQGCTGHSFQDYNHVDLTTMNGDMSENLNDGRVKGIAVGNRLGPGIGIASIKELGPGGSWSTCAMGCHLDPPEDVAHVQFRSRVAFKLVWVPNENFDSFVLVDDDGNLLAQGKPSDGPGALPQRREREMNYRIMKGSKYARVADELANNSTSA